MTAEPFARSRLFDNRTVLPWASLRTTAASVFSTARPENNPAVLGFQKIGRERRVNRLRRLKDLFEQACLVVLGPDLGQVRPDRFAQVAGLVTRLALRRPCWW